MYVPTQRVELVRTGRAKYKATKVTSSTTAMQLVAEITQETLRHCPVEQFWVLTLDTKLKPLNFHFITQGILDASLVHPREVFIPTLLDHAASILLVHNHPSGDLTPSREDHAVTTRLKDSGAILGINVYDHIIVGEDDDGVWRGLSMAENGEF